MCLFLCFVLVHCFKQSANTVEHLHNILKFFICELTHHNFILFIHRPHSFHKLIMNFSPKFYGGSNLSFKIHDINMKRCLSHFKKTLTMKKTAASKMLTAVHLLLELFLNECHFKMTIAFVSRCLMTLVLKSPFRFIED